MSNTLSSSLGVNRLRSGFAAERSTYRSSSNPDTPPDTEESLARLTARDVIYDLTTEDDDGGVVLNVNGEVLDPIIISDDENNPSERFQGNTSGIDTPIINGITELSTQFDAKDEGSIDNTRYRGVTKEFGNNTQPEPMVIDSENQTSGNTALIDSAFIIDTGPSNSFQICLKDLSPSQLEDQIRYAFWYLERHQIDLSRPVRCLSCQKDGHLDGLCPQKTCTHCGTTTGHESAQCPTAYRCENCRERGHNKSNCKNTKNTAVLCEICSSPDHQEAKCPLKHFLHSKDSSWPVKLWISCCKCTSRTHLVGDCPEAHLENAARWSLRSLNPAQVTNLSVQASTRTLEREAENRNMRPAGMRIKGRANIHHADAHRRDESDSDDQDFFSYPSATRRPGRYTYHSRSDIHNTRRETSRPITKADQYRPPRNDFYATDSFGRARSRSPGPFRHRDDRARRSPSFDHSSTEDSYRANQGRDSYRGGPSRPNPSQGQARGPVSIQLPARKGSSKTTQPSASKNTANLPAKLPKVNTNGPATNKETLTRKQRKRQKRANNQN